MTFDSNKPILVTGITGYIGAHVALAALKKGYKVRGTARDVNRAKGTFEEHTEFASYVRDGKLEFVEIKDVESSDFTEALKGVTSVAHVASPFNTKFTDPKLFLEPAVNGTKNVIQAAGKAGVTNFVVTSSFAAVLDLGDKKMPKNSKIFTEADWNPVTYEEALKTTNPSFAYCASKTFAEQAAHEYKKASAPNMHVAALNPPMVFGPSLFAAASTSKFNESLDNIWKVLSTTSGDTPPTGFPAFTDVRDLANAHVAALEKGVDGRFLLYKQPYENQQLIDFAHKHFADASKSLIAGKTGTYDVADDPAVFRLDTTRATTELGITFRPFDETFHDMIGQLYEVAAK